MTYQISGVEQNKDNTLWVVTAQSKATAEHIAVLFKKEGYANVLVKELPDA